MYGHVKRKLLKRFISFTYTCITSFYLKYAHCLLNREAHIKNNIYIYSYIISKNYLTFFGK